MLWEFNLSEAVMQCTSGCTNPIENQGGNKDIDNYFTDIAFITSDAGENLIVAVAGKEISHDDEHVQVAIVNADDLTDWHSVNTIEFVAIDESDDQPRPRSIETQNDMIFIVFERVDTGSTSTAQHLIWIKFSLSDSHEIEFPSGVVGAELEISTSKELFSVTDVMFFAPSSSSGSNSSSLDLLYALNSNVFVF